VLPALSGSGILLLDTDHNKKLAEIDVPALRSFKSSPNGAYVVALGRKSMICLQGSTGKVLAQVRGFVNAAGFAFDDGADDGGY